MSRCHWLFTTVSKMAEKDPDVIVKNLSGDPDEMIEVESMCMNCHENGTTRMLPTKIPFFRSVVVSSFSCEHCSFRNAELMQIGDIQPKGVRISVIIRSQEDLNRQLVISPSTNVKIPDVDLDIPPSKGSLTTAEGIIQKTVDDLEYQQPVRRVMDTENAAKIDEFIGRLQRIRTLEAPFTIIMDDPSGNCFVENPNAPRKDDQMTSTHYKRTPAQSEALGYQVEEEEAEQEEETEAPEEVITFQIPCSNCQAMCETRMKQVEIPHFKEVIIMATNCDKCGFRDNEVKSGTGVEPKGRKIILRITDSTDLSRDVLKSDMAAVRIRELDFETEEGTLGGKFTTIEGLLTDIKNQLGGDAPFVSGDSAVEGRRSRMDEFLQELGDVISGKRKNIHFELDDPSGNCYVQNVYAPDPDPEMEIIEYERNYEQNELLGLNDIKTENYKEES